VTLWLWGAVAFGHGGPPRSSALLWDGSGQMTVSSSHGLLFEDGGWDWVCEEVFGSALQTGIVRTSEALVVGTTSGAVWSDTGCDWTWTPELIGQVIWDIAPDPSGSDGLWLATEDGLWWSDDHGAHFAFHDTPNPEASIRSFVPLGDGHFAVLGFLHGQATAWWGGEDGWSGSPLPVTGGHLIALGSGESGNVYGRFPSANGSDELLRISPDGNATRLLQTETSIGAFVAVDGRVLVSVDGQGIIESTDHGAHWTLQTEQTVGCLVAHDDQIWACPTDDTQTLWARSDGLDISEYASWTMGPRFVEVSEPRCANELPQCNDLWPQVSEELGIESLDTGVAAKAGMDNGQCGCGSSAAVLLFPWGLLWADRRRLRGEDHRIDGRIQ
jgi:hypothetical protein